MNILDKLAALSLERAEADRLLVPEAEMREKAALLGPGGGKNFLAALRRPGISFICEIKKASPSKGLISPDVPYLEIAGAYERAGAACPASRNRNTSSDQTGSSGMSGKK